MKKQSKQALLAEEVLAQARAIVDSLGEKITFDDRVKVFAKLDVSVARVLFKKQKQSAKVYKSIEAAASDFWDQLKAIVGDDCPSNPWDGHEQPPSGDSATPCPSLADKMQQFTADGKLVPGDLSAELKRVNLSVGDAVAHRSDKDAKLLLKSIISEELSVLVEDADGKPHTVDIAKFIKEYSKYEEVNFSIEAKFSMAGNVPLQRSISKGHVLSAIELVAKSCEKPSVRLQAKPSKKAIAEKDYKVGSLVLVAETDRIVVVDGTPKSKAPAGGIEIGKLNPNLPEDVFHVAPPQMNADTTKQSLNAGFWVVKKTTDPDIVNMQLTKVTVEPSVKFKTAVTNFTAIDVPVMKNTQLIKTGDELYVLDWTADKEDEQDGEEDGGDDSQAKGKGNAAPSKATSKGKAKAKASQQPKAGQLKRKRGE